MRASLTRLKGLGDNKAENPGVEITISDDLAANQCKFGLANLRSVLTRLEPLSHKSWWVVAGMSWSATLSPPKGKRCKTLTPILLAVLLASEFM